MNTALGRERATMLLIRSAGWVSREADEGRWHISLIRAFGKLALDAELPSVSGVASRLLARAPDSAFTEGLITNMLDLSALVQRELSSDGAARHSPPYSRQAVLDMARACGAVERLALEGRFAEAEAAASSDFEKECYVSTRALAGDVAGALACLEEPTFPASRRIGPLMVACIESHRAGDDVLSGQLLARLTSPDICDPWSWVQLSAGYLGFVPWGGYPYADY